jgi:hypothetical protein
MIIRFLCGEKKEVKKICKKEVKEICKNKVKEICKKEVNKICEDNCTNLQDIKSFLRSGEKIINFE